MGEELDRAWTEMAGQFDALVGEIERVVQYFVSAGASEADLERLQRVKIIVERGATIARTISLDESD